MILNIFFRVMLALCIVGAASGLVAVGMFIEHMCGPILREIILVLLVLIIVGVWCGAIALAHFDRES